MQLITGTVKKAGINKHHAIFRCPNALFQIQCRSALFIHNADLNSIARKLERIFYLSKQVTGKLHFFWAMHFRFYNIHRTFAAITTTIIVTFKVMHSSKHSDHAIKYSFRHLVTIFIQHSINGHQVTHITHK